MRVEGIGSEPAQRLGDDLLHAIGSGGQRSTTHAAGLSSVLVNRFIGQPGESAKTNEPPDAQSLLWLSSSRHRLSEVRGELVPNRDRAGDHLGEELVLPVRAASI